MPNKTVYIRKEDLETWNKLNKPVFLALCLQMFRDRRITGLETFSEDYIKAVRKDPVISKSTQTFFEDKK